VIPSVDVWYCISYSPIELKSFSCSKKKFGMLNCVESGMILPIASNINVPLLVTNRLFHFNFRPKKIILAIFFEGPPSALHTDFRKRPSFEIGGAYIPSCSVKIKN
jgi:hypothetical protein